MAVKVIRDGEVVYSDKKPSTEQVLEQQAKIIQDLQNQIKDLQKQKQNNK
jgi:hypothetical protein